MNAPLSLFLTQFSAAPPPPPPALAPLPDFEVEEPSFDLPQEFESTFEMPSEDVEDPLPSAVDEARAALEQEHAEALEAVRSQAQVDKIEAVSAARSEWVASTSETLAGGLDEAFRSLRDELAGGIANVLRPLIADHFMAQAARELTAALDRLLADPQAPSISVSGPDDLCEALRAKLPGANVEWVSAEKVEVAIISGVTRIESRFAEALSDLQAAGAPNHG